MYQIERTRQKFRNLSDAHDATRVGDVILFDGRPAFLVTSRNRLDFIAPA